MNVDVFIARFYRNLLVVLLFLVAVAVVVVITVFLLAWTM